MTLRNDTSGSDGSNYAVVPILGLIKALFRDGNRIQPKQRQHLP